MAWLDLVVPSAALLALFAVLALIVVAVQQGRKLRKLEDRLARSGDAAFEAPLQRIAELQARHAPSSGVSAPPRDLRRAGLVGLVAIALIAAIGGVWYLFVRDGGGSGSSADTPAATTTATTGTTPVEPPTPVDTTLVPENLPPVADKTIFTVMVFNATGIAGAAGEVVAPALQNEGWIDTLVANEPDGLTGHKESVVMFAPGKGNRNAARNVAKDLGVKRAPPLDGYTAEEILNADVVVVVGLDLAEGVATTTTP
jgi:hypothetical protein